VKGSKSKAGTVGGAPKWRLRVFLGRTAEGKMQYDSKTFIGTAREADAELGRMIELAHPGGSARTVDARKRTFSAALALWRTKDAHKKSPPTVRGYESNLARHILPELGDDPVAKITPKRLAALFEKLSESGLKASTVNNVHTAISAVLQRAVLEDWLTSNPARAVKRARVDWRPPTAPEGDSLVQLLDAIDDEDDRALVLLAVVTGARRGELCALRWSDLDLEAGRVEIARSLVVGTEAGAGLVEKDTKTHAARTNELPALAVDALRVRRARAERWAKTCGTELDAEGFVFSDEPRGLAPWRPDLVSHRWARVRARAGLPKVRFHDLRHFAASEALAAGEDPVTVRDRLGHRSLDTTNLYAHSRREADAKLATALDGRMRALLGE
jgi:integrase